MPERREDWAVTISHGNVSKCEMSSPGRTGPHHQSPGPAGPCWLAALYTPLWAPASGGAPLASQTSPVLLLRILPITGGPGHTS